MAQQVGDLWPYSSGTASLGVEQLNGPQGGFTSEIRPFNHVHLNSGVWHDPIYGQSGVIRFSQRIGGFEYSVDGGRSFSPMIDLQGAYNYGQFIAQAHRPAPSYIAGASLKSQHDPVVIGHTDPGAGNSAGYDILSALRDASIVASGFSLTPNLVNTFAYTAILPGTIAMQASGIASQGGAKMIISCSDLAQAVYVQVSGSVLWTANNDILFVQGGTGSIGFLNPGDGTGAGGQIYLSPFDGSGILEYRLGGIGGHQAWHWKPSYASAGGPNNDGYFPIPHSGQIIGMIAQNGVSLQQAYYNGRGIVTEQAYGGPVSIHGDLSYDLSLSVTEADHPHLLVSGVSEMPLDGVQQGAHWLQGHTAGWTSQLQGLSVPSDYAVSRARSLGPDTWFMHTGSGLVNLRVGSGIAQFFNGGASAAITEAGLTLPINTASTPDTWFHVTNASGIRPWVPGKYRITYTAVLEKTQGNLAQAVTTELRFYDRQGNQFRMLGSSSAAYVRDSNMLNVNSANGQWMGDLREGISIFLFAQATEAPPADNTIRARSRTCNVIMEWIGPLSAGQAAIQKVT